MSRLKSCLGFPGFGLWTSGFPAWCPSVLVVNNSSSNHQDAKESGSPPFSRLFRICQTTPLFFSNNVRLAQIFCVGYIQPIMDAIRVPKAKFKYNMRPFVDEAKGGKVVIVTNDGEDEFQVVPCVPSGRPPGMSAALDAKAYQGINLDEPAFKSWEDA